MSRTFTTMRVATAALTLWSALQATVWVTIASAQGRSKPPVEQGTEYYEQSRFDEAITLLRDLVDRGVLTGDELLRAREILARSYVKKGYPIQGREMFRAILRDQPAYRPDPIRVPPDETAVFELALREHQAGTPMEAQPVPGTAARDTVAAPPARTEPVPASTLISEPGTKKPLMKQWWVWAGGAALIAGVALAMSGGGGGDDPQPLPGFPPPPTGVQP